MKTVDRTFHLLCEEIDDLKQEVEYWKKMYKFEVDERNAETFERNETTKRDLANVFKLAFATSNDEDGNLIISKENRKKLIEEWKQ